MIIISIKSRNIRKKIKIYFWAIAILLLFIITIHYANSVSFSEILANPSGNDQGREWIELSNPECQNLTGYTLLENGVTHQLTYYVNGDCKYPIICSDCQLILGTINASPAMYESSFTLNNNGEYLAIMHNNSIIDEINYSAVSEGQSFSKQNETWVAATPTPGIINNIELLKNITENVTENITHNQTNNITINETTNSTYNITINETSTNTSINESIANNQTNNETNGTNSMVYSCNITIGIKLKEEQQLYKNKESLKFINTLNSTGNSEMEVISNYSIEYWIENIDGDIIKNKIITNNLNEKSYTPNTEYKFEALLIKNRIKELPCENYGHNTSEKLLIIYNSDYTSANTEDEEESTQDCSRSETEAEYDLESDSTLKISISETGDIIKINAYRGNTQKYVIAVYAKNNLGKKIHEYGKIRLEKYSGSEVEYPKLIDNYCGKITIYAEGLGFIEKQEQILECETNKTSFNEFQNETQIRLTEQSSAKTSNDTKNTYNYTVPTGNVVYESKSEYSKKYSFIGIMLLVASFLIYFSYKAVFKKSVKKPS